MRIILLLCFTWDVPRKSDSLIHVCQGADSPQEGAAKCDLLAPTCDICTVFSVFDIKFYS